FAIFACHRWYLFIIIISTVKLVVTVFAVDRT
ncbi:hypothetical protein GCK32_006379, partial [Trichostrongylus colubriformis]